MRHTLFSSYLKAIAWLIPISLMTVFAFNRFMDPFDIFDGPRIEGINANKPHFLSHLRMSKAIAVQRLKPTAIILGTSRAEAGIDPLHPGWSDHPVYNLAISSANIYEIFRYLQHAQAVQPLKQVVLMLDFFMFNAVSQDDKQDFDERRLAVDVEGYPQGSNYDIFSSIASLDAFRSSIDTFFKQSKTSDYFPNGMSNNTEIYNVIQWKGGNHYEFIFSENCYLNNLYNNFNFATAKRDLWQVYRQLIAMVYQQKLGLHIVISPSHARQFEAIAVKGLWQTFEQWKLQLVQINEQEAAKSGEELLPIWDFSGYNSYTTEKVPPLGDANTEMQWYWESSHYKKELGDLVLDRVFGHQEPGRTVHPDFGTLITSENIELHLRQVRNDRQKWRTSFPEDAQEIERLGRAIDISKIIQKR